MKGLPSPNLAQLTMHIQRAFPEGARAGIVSVYLFGSHVEGRAHREGDVDVERLRRVPGARRAPARAPFFELHGERFTLIAAETGICRRLDARQHAWFVSALGRARGTFTMVLLGHPLFAGGDAQTAGDPPFGEVHELLRRFGVPLVMAGGTHDF